MRGPRLDSDSTDKTWLPACCTLTFSKWMAGAGTLAAALIVVGGSGCTYWELVGSRYVSTDNAYTAVESALVTSAITGTIADVRVNDTQAVKKADILVVIDPTDAKLALAQAEADLGRAIRRVKGYVATDAGLGAQRSRERFERGPIACIEPPVRRVHHQL